MFLLVNTSAPPVVLLILQNVCGNYFCAYFLHLKCIGQRKTQIQLFQNHSYHHAPISTYKILGFLQNVYQFLPLIFNRVLAFWECLKRLENLGLCQNTLHSFAQISVAVPKSVPKLYRHNVAWNCCRSHSDRARKSRFKKKIGTNHRVSRSLKHTAHQLLACLSVKPEATSVARSNATPSLWSWDTV